MIEKAQKNFLENEIWVLSFNAAFQRNKIYNANATDRAKKMLRREIRDYITSNIILIYKKTDVNEKQHLAFIISIIDISKYHQAVLKNGKLSVGTVQKLFNLVLKYYWCLGLINEPPHFPIDSIIQKLLPANKRISWTTIDTIEEYLSIMSEAKKLLGTGESLAMWELNNFRRNSAL